MKTSVVVTTYNGAKYIIEQLESIKDQTVTADEVLIFDDISTDNTAELCEKFIIENNLSNWRFVINKINKGFKQNFYDGFKRATGDIIFITDQDDIWHNNKIERTVAFFYTNPQALSVNSAFSRFNEGQILSDHVIVPNRRRNSVKKISINEFCRFHFYLGMTTAFRKEILSLHFQDCYNAIPYDIAVNFIATVNKQFYYIDEVLVKRRSYAESVSNSISTKWANEEFHGNKNIYTLYRIGLNLDGFIVYLKVFNPDSSDIPIIEKHLHVNKLKALYIENKKIFNWLSLIKYVPKFITIKGFFKGVILILKR